MLKRIIVLSLLAIVVFKLSSYGVIAASSGYGRQNGYMGRYNNYGKHHPHPVSIATAAQSKEYLDSKSGLSTFGIISMLFAIILFCLVFYYGVMCYPFLCKSEKKYQFMNVSSTITATTSRSIQSIENFSLDQKH